VARNDVRYVRHQRKHDADSPDSDNAQRETLALSRPTPSEAPVAVWCSSALATLPPVLQASNVVSRRSGSKLRNNRSRHWADLSMASHRQCIVG